MLVARRGGFGRVSHRMATRVALAVCHGAAGSGMAADTAALESFDGPGVRKGTQGALGRWPLSCTTPLLCQK